MYLCKCVQVQVVSYLTLGLLLQSKRCMCEQRSCGLKNLKFLWFYISQQETLGPHDKLQWGERRQGNQPSAERRGLKM